MTQAPRLSAPIAAILVALAACAPATGAQQPPPQGTAGSGGGSACPDADRDGHYSNTCGGDDCDDSDASVHPGLAEICKDGKDQNCDGQIDEGCDCSTKEMRACWSGAPENRGVGVCRDGWQRCDVHGKWSEGCAGEVHPSAEPDTCDGIDQDCDGKDVPSCAGCKTFEMCGNGIDDDCNGIVDDPDVCNATCLPSETPLPDSMVCCGAGYAFSYECVDAPGLTDCGQTGRPCLDLDGDPSTRCVSHCTSGGCVCGRPAAGGFPAPVPDCGFETPCNRLGCEGRTGQSCYTGPPATLGKGICHAGITSCADSGWGACTGEVTPGTEICGNGLDDDCDGLIDESDAAGHSCPRTDCAGQEVCGNQVDDDCDGFVDEGCAADSSEQPCYSGPISTSNNLGICHAGKQQRQLDGHWGPCVGEVLPAPERCGDGVDSNCNGAGGPDEPEDAGCCVPTGPEACNGLDDDCDGLVDEGLVNACGSCAMSCPGTLAIDDLGTCQRPGRTCTSLLASAMGLTVAPPASPDQGLYYFVQTGNVNVIRRFDTAHGRFDWDYTLEGHQPYIYAASPDGTLWLSDPDVNKLVHVGSKGQVLCTYSLAPDFALGLAVDENGDAWVLRSEQYVVQKFPARSFSGTPASCVPAQLGVDGILNVGVPIRQLVMGPPPALWGVGPIGVRIDRNTLEVTQVTMPRPLYPPLRSRPDVDDKGNIWFDVDGDLVQIGANDDGSMATRYANVGFTELAHRGDGLVWGRDGNNRLASFDPATGMVQPITTPAGWLNVFLPAADATGNLWVHAESATGFSLQSYDPTTATWTGYPDEAPLRIDTDKLSQRTASHLAPYAGNLGTLVQDVDGGSNALVWTTLSWTADVPVGTELQAFIKIADRADKLDAASLCGPFVTSPTDLSTCFPGKPLRGRALRLQFDMISSAAGTPALHSVHLDYDRP